MKLTDQERDDLRARAQAKNCSGYLLLPLRTLEEACKELGIIIIRVNGEWHLVL